jgi:hypothetical protein
MSEKMPGETEKHYKKPQSAHYVFRHRFERRTFREQVNSVTASSYRPHRAEEIRVSTKIARISILSWTGGYCEVCHVSVHTSDITSACFDIRRPELKKDTKKT